MFLFSLSFEILQLSALLGIYPRPYRLFDVDDLIINTIGGCIGYSYTPLFSFFLPNRENLDLTAYHKGNNVSGAVAILLFDILFPLLTHGQTIGKYMVKIKLVQKDHKKATWYQIMYQFGCLYC